MPHCFHLAGEKIYSMVPKLFQHPGKLIVLWCFLVVFCQNLRGVLHAASLDNGIFGKPLAGLMLLLVGSVIGIQVIRRKISRRWLSALALSGVIFAASPWNPMLLWMFLLGGVAACFPFRLFAKCNVISLAAILGVWLVLVSCGVVPSDYMNAKKVIWMKFFNFGFNSPNTLSLFLFQLAAFGYLFIRRRKFLVPALIPAAFAIFWFSGGRSYSAGILLIGVLHFLPKRGKRFAVRSLGVTAAALLLLSLLLGYGNPQESIFYSSLNYRIPYWHDNLMRDTSVKSILLGRNLNKKAPEPVPVLPKIISREEAFDLLPVPVKKAAFESSGREVGTADILIVDNARWKRVGCGNFNGNGNRDILWQNTGDHSLRLWLNGSTYWVDLSACPAGTDRKIIGIGDVNSDGRDDILFSSPAGLGAWDISGILNGMTRAPAEHFFRIVFSGDWKIIGFPDTNGNGTADILLWHDNGYVGIYMDCDSNQFHGIISMASKAVWELPGFADLNGDGGDDILVRNIGTGAMGYWDGKNNFSWNTLDIRRKTPPPTAAPPAVLDSAYLQLFIKTGILGVCTFFWLLFAALKNHRNMLYRLLPVWCAIAFVGFFESHVFGSSMLGLLPVYFFFHRKGKC